MCLDVNETVQDTVKAIEDDLGPNAAIGRICDVSKEDQVVAAIDECCNTFGGVDICLANAGVSGFMEFFTEIEVEHVRAVFDVNVIGVLLLFKHAAKKMIELGSKGG